MGRLTAVVVVHTTKDFLLHREAAGASHLLHLDTTAVGHYLLDHRVVTGMGRVRHHHHKADTQEVVATDREDKARLVPLGDSLVVGMGLGVVSSSRLDGGMVLGIEGTRGTRT